jgi:hypothetical protein
MCQVLSAKEIEAATHKQVADFGPDKRGDPTGPPASCLWQDAATGEVASAAIEKDYGLTGNDLLIDSQPLKASVCDLGRWSTEAFSDGSRTVRVRCVAKGYDWELNIDAPLPVALQLVGKMETRLAK